MFDANMRHLPKGHKFIAAVWGVKPDTVLAQHGVRKDDLCLCTMMGGGSDNPRVTFHLDGHDVVVSSHDEGMFAYHILYMGTVEPDGSLCDFLHSKDLERANQFMEIRRNGK